MTSPGFEPRSTASDDAVRRRTVAGDTRPPHRHDNLDPACRAARLAELRRAIAAVEAAEAAIELGAEYLDRELALVVAAADGLAGKLRRLEGIDGDRRG